MRRITVTLAAAGALALSAAAAPALSLHRWHPEPVEFQLAAPARAVQSASEGGLVSHPLRAPKRFNLVGLRWRGAAEPRLALRTRSAEGGWSGWTPVPAHSDGGPDPGRGEPAASGTSAPVWAGEADYVQYRSSEPLRGLRLQFVNTTGTATAADRALTAVRRLVNGATLAVAGPASARADDGQPPIVPRADWGAEHCTPRRPPAYGEVKAAIVHHTVTTNDYSPEQAPAAVLAICRYHRNTNRWNDIGYNFVVDRYGTVYEGRAGGVDRAVIGAQAQGYNAQTTGIANLGTHSYLPQTEAAVRALAELIRWKLPLHGEPTAGTVVVTSAGGRANRYPAGTAVELDRVSGHRDGGRTACPGDALYEQLPDLRELVGGALPQRPRTRIEAGVRPRLVRFPGEALVSGRLRLLKGEPVAGALVEIQRFGGRGRFGDRPWQTVARTPTGGDGGFTALVTPAGRRILRARFPGSSSLVGSTSRATVVQVRAAVTATRSVSRAAVGRTPLVMGRVRPAKRRVIVVVQRRAGGRNRRVAAMRAPARGGRFRKGFRLKSPGLYRFFALFPGDPANLAAASRPFYIRAVPPSGGARTRRRR